MRVITGEARGRRLAAWPGETTRPTADRVKEALFSALLPRLDSAHVLDLFAGSGALAIEALSRGAADAVLVEKEKQAVMVIHQNLAATGFAHRSDVRHSAWDTALDRLAAERHVFDIVFVDPPYGSGYYEAVLVKLFGGALLAQEGIVVCEHHRDMALEARAGMYTVRKTRRYGRTMLSYVVREEKSG